MSRIHEHRGLLEQEPEIRRQLEGLHWTDLDSYRPGESRKGVENAEVKPRDTETVDSQRAELDDDELVSLFSELHKHDLRYTAEWGRWNEWDGRRWKTDNKLHAHHLGRLVCRLARRKYPQSQMGHRITSSLTMAAVERWARADPQHAITPAQWDADPWLLNTPAGTVDLRNGVLRPAASADYCTKITAVAPGGECPLWMAFLARITDGDPGLQEFIQRMCGYALTGETREHALFFLYGTGANGKSVFLNTISDVMGLCPDSANGVVYRVLKRAPSHGVGRAAGRKTGFRGRNGGRSPLGGEQDKGAYLGRTDLRAIHASRLLSVCSTIQAGDRGKSQAGTPNGG